MLNLGCGVRTHRDWVNIDWSLKLRLSRLPLAGRLAKCPPGVRIHDLRKGIPFPDGSADVVYASHVLEHLQVADARLFLKEMWRVLKPGGTVRVVVPDLEGAARRYLQALADLSGKEEDRGAVARYEWCTILLLDQMVRTTPGGEMSRWLRENADSEVVGALRGTFREIARSAAQKGGGRGLLEGVKSLLRPADPAASGELHRWMYDRFSLKRLLLSAGFCDVAEGSHLESRVAGWPAFLLDNNEDGTPHQPDSVWMEGRKSGGAS